MDKQAFVAVEIWGDYACFTRPEFKAERVSYPVMTPSAARGVLEAIFWKPEIRYEIRRIGVLSLGRQTSILRNELGNQQTKTPTVVENQRQQRNSLVLKDVAYIIKAEAILQRHASAPIYKYTDQFNRRVKRGQYHHTPYLGTREFAASFAPVDGDVPDESLNLELGMMLLDNAYVPDTERKELTFGWHDNNGNTPVSGFTETFFFPARLEQGWLHVPRGEYEKLREIEQGGSCSKN